MTHLTPRNSENTRRFFGAFSGIGVRAVLTAAKNGRHHGLLPGKMSRYISFGLAT